jgi:hypothetical protein
VSGVDSDKEAHPFPKKKLLKEDSLEGSRGERHGLRAFGLALQPGTRRGKLQSSRHCFACPLGEIRHRTINTPCVADIRTCS